MDGFDQDQGASESDEGGVAFGGLLAAHGDALEALQLADGLLDPGAGSCRAVFGKNSGLFLAFERYGMTGTMRRRRQAARLAAES